MIIRLKSAFALAAMATTWLHSDALHAAVSTINPAADAFVDSQQPDNNYGSAGALGVSSGTLPKGEFDTLIRFDPAASFNTFNGIYGVGGWTVQSVVLSLTSASPNNPLFNGSGSSAKNTAGSFKVNDMASIPGFIEGNGTPAAGNTTPGAVTFNNQPTSATDEALGTFSYSGVTPETDPYTLTVIPDMATEIQTDAPVNLRLLPASDSIAYIFNSEQFGTATSRPALTITAVAIPEPASIFSLAIIGSGLMLRRQRAIA